MSLKIDTNFYQKIQSAPEEQKYSVCVTYEGPAKHEYTKNVQENMNVLHAYLDRKLEYYTTNNIEYNPLYNICTVVAALSKGQIEEVLKDKDVGYIADGDMEIGLIRPESSKTVDINDLKKGKI